MAYRRFFSSLAIVASLAGVYFGAGKLGLMLAFVHPSATAVWPPTGIALAALLTLGYHVWPGIFLGAFLVNVTTEGSVATSLGIAVGNTLEGLAGAYLVNRFANGRYPFDRPQDIFKFVLLAGMLSTTVSATFGVASLSLGGFASWADYGSIWFTWWLGDAVGALIVASVLLLWSANPRLQWSRGQVFEAALLLLSLVLAGLVVFGGWFPSETKNYPLAFLSIPLLIWAAFRFGQREAATATLVLAGIATWGTLNGLGPFAGQSPNESLLLLQAFIGVVAMLAIALAAAVSERRSFEAQLVHLVAHDPLTGLFSRRRFQEELSLQLALARRYGTRGALLFLDLDDFKSVNDSLGHRTGDELLISLARLLRERLRESDLLARLGGDEFAVVLPHVDGNQAQVLAGRLLETIRHHSITAKGQSIGITASIGIALFPEYGVTIEELLAHADRALYQAKEKGRNRLGVCAPDKDWQAQMEGRLKVEQRIRQALEEDLFLLYAQPILDLRSHRIEQYELLLRMVGEGGLILPPSNFLYIAERFGLIHDIDRWVVQQAIHLLARHSQAFPELGFSVNLSGKAFLDEELLPIIKRELERTSTNPASLILEITESAAIADTNQAQKFAHALKTLGCRFALDDFGVGFSSLSHLKHLPVDYLKIDGSFVRDLPNNPVDQHLVKAMVEVARALHKETIAEFVGSEETVQLLRQYGVDFAQGFYIGEPRAVSEVLSERVSATVGRHAILPAPRG